MQIWFDFGDGSGPQDYTAALAVAPETTHFNVLKNVESLTIERERNSYARCRGTLDVAAAGLKAPQQGCRVAVRTDGGRTLFAGTVVQSPAWVQDLLNSASPLRFEAVEDAFLSNTPLPAGLQPAGAATHSVCLQQNEVVLQTASTETAEARADDVLVTGGQEPVTYVTELFQGDGTTSTFTLTQRPFAPSGSTMLLSDSFTEPRFRGSMWQLLDPGQHIAMGSGGLRITGGNGFDGQTYLAAQEDVELGGTLCAEMHGVLLQAGSAGVLLGMYGNVVTASTCFAGFQVNSTGGAQTLTAIVDGTVVGQPYTWSVGHRYTLRLRLHSAEMQRVLLTYQAVVNGAVQTWGGGLVDSPMQMVFEVLDEGLASSTPATVLYAGAVSSSLAQAIFAPVNSESLVMSAAAISLKGQGSAWVTTTELDGTVTPRRPGSVNTGEDYRINGTSLEFFAGREPAAGALVSVRYRLGQRAQGRMQNSAAAARMQQLGLPGLRQSSCRVTTPEPRCSADCAAAAAALLSFYGDPAYGVRGTCTIAIGGTDLDTAAEVNAGDLIALPLGGAPTNVPVQTVRVRSGHSVPETLAYDLTFALGKKEALSFRSENGAAGDAALPAEVYVTPATASLPDLAVTIVSATALQVDAGTAPPVGGGFEVRRHDGGWGPDQLGAGVDTELVLRSPVRSFSVPRAGFAERFYVRMYDGSQVPVYSAQSSLISTHLPTG